MGGTTSIVAALVKLLGELGVEVRLNAPVEEIEVANGKVRAVRLENGERIPCGTVVSNADPTHTYSRLISSRHLRHNTPSRTGRVRQSMSLFVAYFGARTTYPHLAHHTIVLGERYRGLLDDIFKHRKLADDFSLYLHAPTRTDPSLAPDGHEGFYVLSPVPNTRSNVDWDNRKQAYFESIVDRLETRLLPGLGAKLMG